MIKHHKNTHNIIKKEIKMGLRQNLVVHQYVYALCFRFVHKLVTVLEVNCCNELNNISTTFGKKAVNIL